MGNDSERRLVENEYRLERTPERHLEQVVPITSPPVIEVERMEVGKGNVEVTVECLDVEREMGLESGGGCRKGSWSTM